MKERFDNSFHGFDEGIVTFSCTDRVKAGMLVTMASNHTVRPARDGEPFIGVTVGVRDNFAAIQIRGYVECKAAYKIPVGRASVVSAGSDEIMVDDYGVPVWIVESYMFDYQPWVGLFL